MYDIRFPNLGIVLKNIKDGFTIFGFEIKFYGVIIALGFVLAFLVISKEAKRTGQSEDTYLDFMLWLIIPAILGARLYYIIFSWDSYFQKGKGFGKTLFDLIDIRSGGLAIYGGVIAGVIVAIVFAKKRKMKFSVLADTVTMGLLIGRWNAVDHGTSDFPVRIGVESDFADCHHHLSETQKVRWRNLPHVSVGLWNGTCMDRGTAFGFFDDSVY